MRKYLVWLVDMAGYRTIVVEASDIANAMYNCGASPYDVFKVERIA